MKPISCGGRQDAVFLMKCAGVRDAMETVNPIALRYPLSPSVSAKLEGLRIEFNKITRALAVLEKKYEVIVIEGCGGLLVPVSADFFVIDLIQFLNAKTLLVSRSGLGAINHCLLSFEALRKRSIRPFGTVFSRVKSGAMGVAEKTNPAVIAGIVRVKTLGIFPHVKDFAPAALASVFGKHSDLKIINSVLN